MPIGDDQDFRMVGFRQVKLYDGQDHIGGSGSAMLSQETPPFGGSNASPPSSTSTTLMLGDNNFTFPGTTLPNIPPPVIYVNGGGTSTSTPLTVTGPGGSPSFSPVETIEFDGTAFASLVLTGTTATISYDGGGAAPGTITVSKIDAPATSFSGISTVQFTGAPSISVTNPSAGVALVTLKSTILYGQISGAVKQATAIWHYTVTLTSGGGSVTAFNLLEKENNTTNAYGYAVQATGGFTLLTGTNFSIKQVPLNTWVRLERTAEVTGVLSFWFSAPNMIDGGC